MAVAPMLASVYDEKRVTFPCVVQPKLDGVRMTMEVRADGTVGSMRSRTGSDFSHLRSVLGLPVAPTQRAAAVVVVLDGELYVHGLGFQRIVSLVKNRMKRHGTTPRKLEYHVYDAWLPSSPGAPLLARLEAAKMAADGLRSRGGRVRDVHNITAATPAAVQTHLVAFMRKGYEGIMVRDPAAQYEPGRRSRSLSKLKQFDDADFEVVGFEEASGKDKGTVVLICQTESGALFKVRPRGTHSQRSRMLHDAPRAVGKYLTVRFQGRTDSGIPRFPVGVAFRDYE